MDHNNEQSSANIDNIDNIENIDTTLPFVDALTTPFPPTITARNAVTLQKIKAREKDIQTYKRQIQELDFAIAIQESYALNIQHAELISPLPSAPPADSETIDAVTLRAAQAQEREILLQEEEINSLLQSLASKKQEYAKRTMQHSPTLRRTLETPGPHRLQPRPERPADITYREQQKQQEEAEKDQANTTVSSSQDEIVNVFKSLTKVLSDNNKQLHSNDVSDPPKFHGQDSQWDDWYLQWRTYLEAKGWLTTFEHATGPGTIGFDNDINKKIYNKLLSLCQKGTASTYVTKAANFNGWEAAKYLLERYEGFSKQRQRSLRQLIENIRHVHGTNMSRHVDKFERICGQMAHNNPHKPPTDEQKIDWFLESVTERTYDSVHAACTDKLLDGDLTYAKVIKLYTHRCFLRYPHFQVEDLDRTDKTTLTNNSTTVRQRHDKGGKGQGRSSNGRGRGRDRQPRNSNSRTRDSPHRSKGKGKGKGSQNKRKGKDDSTPPNTNGTRQPKLEPCSYCGGANHNARNCFKRLAEEKGNTTKVHKQANQNVLIDETAMEFSQSVLLVNHTEPSQAHHTVDWGENETAADNEARTINSDNGQTHTEEKDTKEVEQEQANEEHDPTVFLPTRNSP